MCEPPLFAVADGMGGAQAGELASRLAAAALEELGASARGEDGRRRARPRGERRIYRRSLEDPAAAGMGTTATVALVDEAAGDVAIGHVGDSRAYRLRDGELEQLTADHSLVARARAQRPADRGGGRDPPAALGDHARARHRARGRRRHADGRRPAGRPVPALLRRADRRCSATARSSLSSRTADGDLDRAAAALVAAANRAGGEDNITVVVFESRRRRPRRATRTADPGPTTPTRPRAADDRRAVAEHRADGVRRHGAGHGSRWVALGAVLVAVAIARWSCCTSGSRDERTQQGAVQPRLRRVDRLRRLRERLDRALRRGRRPSRWPRSASSRCSSSPRTSSSGASPPPPTRRCCRSPASSARSG